MMICIMLHVINVVLAENTIYFKLCTNCVNHSSTHSWGSYERGNGKLGTIPRRRTLSRKLHTVANEKLFRICTPWETNKKAEENRHATINIQRFFCPALMTSPMGRTCIMINLYLLWNFCCLCWVVMIHTESAWSPTNLFSYCHLGDGGDVSFPVPSSWPAIYYSEGCLPDSHMIFDRG